MTPDEVDLEQWRHLATLGRDHYVRVMYKGYLCPFGHAASLVKVTERKFESLDAKPSQRVALLRQRFFIVVREPRASLQRARHQHGGRDFPFTQVEILTRVTPDLSAPGEGAARCSPRAAQRALRWDDLAQRMLFWPMVPAGRRASWQSAVRDRGHRSRRQSRDVLNAAAVCRQAGRRQAIGGSSRSRTTPHPHFPKRRATLGGAIVSYAPSDPQDKGDPKLADDEHHVHGRRLHGRRRRSRTSIRRSRLPKSASSRSRSCCRSRVSSPRSRIPVSTRPTWLHDRQCRTGVSQADLGEAADVRRQRHRQAKSDSLGALASPQMSLLGLSKMMGPVSGKDAADATQSKAS